MQKSLLLPSSVTAKRILLPFKMKMILRSELEMTLKFHVFNYHILR